MYKLFVFIYTNIGDKMNNINVRDYIINNFKNDSIDDIKESIVSSINSKEEDPLIGLGVLFEVMWNNSSDDEKFSILNNIKKGLN